MSLVRCRTLYNEEKYIPAEELIQRPSVYGLILHEDRLLVVETSHTHRYVLPGGGIEKGETIEDALRREVKEETSLDIAVKGFLHFETDFFYYDPLDLAFQGFLFFYHGLPLTTRLTAPNYGPDEGLARPLWVDVARLEAEAFQSHGRQTMALVERVLALAAR